MPQRALFPMEYMRGTQDENGRTSHAGSLAMDWGGRDTGVDKVMAPCDMKFIRVRQDSSHETYAESLEPVLFADGTVDFMHFTFMHDNYLNSNVKPGAAVQQGTYFFDEGGFGYGRVNAFATHLHLEVGRGHSPGRQVRNSYGTWMTPNQVHIYDALWVPADCKVLANLGHPWRRTTDKLLDTSDNQNDEPVTLFKPYNVRPLYKLNVRTGPGTSYAKSGLFALTKYLYTVKEERGSWGRTPIGWIYLPYTKNA